ncbi:hypothetical protein DJ030_07575 [bacterium endosymbiont of Escarpia laminata]|nr:MAG: hypothetical protein DJ030_07575 [bacterium endosymbiont of Escarpia laminata]
MPKESSALVNVNNSNIVFIFLFTAILAGCATGLEQIFSKKPTPLIPIGVLADSKPKIRIISKEFSKITGISIGDEIISIDGKKELNTLKAYSLISKANIIKIRTKSGNIANLKGSDFNIPTEGNPKIGVIIPKTEGFIAKVEDALYKRTQSVAIIGTADYLGVLGASIWKINKGFIEVSLSLHGVRECSDCILKNIGIYDYGKNAWLTPVTAISVAWNLFTKKGEPPKLVNIPDPKITGYSGSTYVSGYSNYGYFYGSGETTLYPIYDYSQVNAAAMYNLFAVIEADRIKADTQSRRKFVNDRVGNIEFKPTKVGEKLQGYFFYHLPNGYTGPYGVYVFSQMSTGVVFKEN